MSYIDWTESETISPPDKITIKWKTDAQGNTPAQEREQLLLSTTRSTSASTYRKLFWDPREGYNNEIINTELPGFNPEDYKSQDILIRKKDTKITTQASVNQEWISARLKYGRGLPAGTDLEISETVYDYRTTNDGPVVIRELTQVFISAPALAGQLQGIPYQWKTNTTPSVNNYYDPPVGFIISQQTLIEHEQAKTAEGRDVTRTKTSRWVALGLTSEGKGSFERWMKVVKDLRIQSPVVITNALLQWSELVFQGTEIQTSVGRIPVPSKPSDEDLAAKEIVNGSQSSSEYTNPDPEVNNNKTITGRVVFDGQSYDDSNPTVTATYEMPYAPDDYFYYDNDVRMLHRSGARNAAIKFGQTESALDIGHAYGQNIVTNFDLTPTLDLSPIYIRLAGIEGAFLLDAPSYAWDSDGMVVSSDLMLIGVSGYDGVTPPATSWLRLPVAPSAIGPAGITTVEASPVKANSIAIPNGFDVRNLAAVFAALPTNGTDLFREWRNQVVIVPPTLVLEREVIAAGPTITVVEFRYELTLDADIAAIASGPVMEFVWVTVAVPSADISITGPAPMVSTGVRLSMPAAALALAAAVPAVTTEIRVMVPAAAIAIAALAPDLVGKARTAVNAPSADVAVAAVAPFVASGASVAVPAADVAIEARHPVVQIAAPDPYFSSVQLLLHMNGSNNSTSFPDSSSASRTVTPVGNARIRTSHSQFGGASAFFDGDGDRLDATVTGGFGSGDFTLEFWFHMQASGGMIFNSRTGGLSNDGFDISSDLRTTTAGVVIFSSLSLSNNQWYYVAITRQGSTMRRFIDGVMDGSATVSDNFSGSDFKIGGSPHGNSGYMDGFIDELRVTRGVARYISNFTPPTEPFPDF